MSYYYILRIMQFYDLMCFKTIKQLRLQFKSALLNLIMVYIIKTHRTDIQTLYAGLKYCPSKILFSGSNTTTLTNSLIQWACFSVYL